MTAPSRAAKPARPKAFVMSAYHPSGGTLMNYHIGHVLHSRFGYECISVNVEGEPGHGIFEYPVTFDSVSCEQMERVIRARDILVSGPIWTPRLFGLRVPAKKVMYLQGFITSPVVDGFFEHYISVSKFTRDFYRRAYGIRSRIIRPFILREASAPPLPWDQRPLDEVLVIGKVLPSFKTPDALPVLFEALRRRLKQRHPALPIKLRLLDIEKQRVPHAELLAQLGRFRYFLTLSPAEGFGLIPLEAMSRSCAVVGFHGVSGLEYMRPGVNCEVVGYPDLDGLVDRLARVVKSPKLAKRLAENGERDSRAFTLETFSSNWTRFFESVL